MRDYMDALDGNVAREISSSHSIGNNQRGECALFSVVFTPPSPRHHGSVWFRDHFFLNWNSKLLSIPEKTGSFLIGPESVQLLHHKITDLSPHTDDELGPDPNLSNK